MLVLPHVIIGATVATLVKNPALSAPLALASHFIADLFPHWNPHLNAELKKYKHLSNSTVTFIFLDCLLSSVVIFVLLLRLPLFAPQFFNLLVCVFLSIFPDLVEIPYYFSKKRSPLIERIVKFQSSHQWDVPAPLGLLIQAIVVIVCFSIINSVLSS